MFTIKFHLFLFTTTTIIIYSINILSIFSHQLDDRLHLSPTNEIRSCLSIDLEEEERHSCRFFAAVMDAGSTGTRLHIFEFSHDVKRPHSPFKLISETFHEVKPGLSAFSQKPENAANSIRELLEIAKKMVPRSLQTHTPITLKATAGLRLLSEEQAKTILEIVELEISKIGFLIDKSGISSPFVGILSGIDEGVFGWFTINYLLGRIKNGSRTPENFVAALDLGGGSSQVTFLPKDFESAMANVPRDFFSHQLKLFGDKINLYTHSYLGNGLVAARLGIAKLSKESKPNDGKLFTACFPNGYTLDDFSDYADNKWIIKSTNKPSFEKCLKSARDYVEQVASIPQLESAEIYAHSYFFDRALQTNLIDLNALKSGGQIRVEDYRIAAQKACSLSATEIGSELWHPWQCLDLTYIYSILHYGYRLTDQKMINVVKKLRKMEVSWALGASFNLLNSWHEHVEQHRQNIFGDPYIKLPISQLSTTKIKKQQHQQQQNSTTNKFSLISMEYFTIFFEYLSEKATDLLIILHLAS